MTKLAVAICNHNRKQMVLACIDAAISSADGECVVCVVDNASTDGSAQAILESYGETVILHQESVNKGSAGGFNRAIKMALAQNPDYVLVLDSDCIISPDTIPALVSFLNEHRDYALVGPKIYWSEPEGVVQELGGTIDWETAQCRGERKNYDERILPRLTGWRETDYVAACCLMARASTINTCGNMDPDYFIYFDDVEWQWRMRLSGARIAVTADTGVRHYCGSANKRSHAPTFYHWRNRLEFFRRYVPAKERRRVVDLICKDAARAIATCRTFGFPNAAGAIMEGTRDGLAGLRGIRDFTGLNLNADMVPDLLSKGWERLDKKFVAHIFEDAQQEDRDNAELLLEDSYGKRLTAQKAFQLSEIYRRELLAATAQIDSHRKSCRQDDLRTGLE